MSDVAVLIPVLGRPHRVRPLLASIAGAPAPAGHRVHPLFLCSPGDDQEIAEVDAAGADRIVVGWPAGHADYARKMNLGALEAERRGAAFVFLAADDLEFQPGWLAQALVVQRRTRACVVGTNDMANRRVMMGHHSTHTLVHVDYLDCGTIDEPDSRKLLHEGYSHNYCDDEAIQTAMARWTWAFARDARVRHMHPDWGTAEWDDTYRKGKQSFWQDQGLYESRRHLWRK